MEKDNKYYSIIENIVKKHKKFPGCEAILDDIIDDVYAHSEVIIGSIANESVINSYLEKVVSTSIITVPKKLNFHPEIRHKVISTLPQVEEILAKQQVAPTVTEPAVEEVVEPVETLVEEEVTLKEPQTEVQLEETQEPEIQPEEEPTVQTKLVDKMINASFAQENGEDNELEALIAQEPAESDFELVEDKIEEAEELPTFSLEEDEQEEVLEDDDAPLETFEEVETPEVEQIEPESALDDFESSLEPEEEILALDESLDLLPASEETLEEVAEIETEEVQDAPAEEDNELELNLGGEELVEQELDDTLSLLDEPAETLEEVSLDFTELPQAENEVSAESDLVAVDELEELASEDSNFKPTDFSKFNVNVGELEEITNKIDVNEISADIMQLNEKRPELNIAKVYDLKYKKNYSVAQIMSELEMSESALMEALNEIVALI